MSGWNAEGRRESPPSMVCHDVAEKHSFSYLGQVNIKKGGSRCLRISIYKSSQNESPGVVPKEF